MSLTLLVVLTTILVVAFAAIGAILAFRREDEHREALEESVATGVDQPASLHPVVDLEACLHPVVDLEACPEQVLGMAGAANEARPSTKAPPAKAPGAERIGKLPPRREVIATTDELTPFTSDDKLPPVPDSDIVAPRSRPELEDEPSSDEGPPRPATRRG